MPYDIAIGFGKGVKDAVATVVSLGLAFSIAGATQAATQCPELSFTAFGLTVGIKTVLQWLNNYRKNK